MGILLLASAWLTGCAPDRKTEADQLEHDLRAMSGVAFADVVYSNGFEIDGDRCRGGVPEASDEEVQAVREHSPTPTTTPCSRTSRRSS